MIIKCGRRCGEKLVSYIAPCQNGPNSVYLTLIHVNQARQCYIGQSTARRWDPLICSAQNEHRVRSGLRARQGL